MSEREVVTGVVSNLSVALGEGSSSHGHIGWVFAVFADCLADAVADGFSGLRVAADNTSSIATTAKLEAWMRWEAVADRFIEENPGTGLCAFDRDRVDRDVLSTVIGAHRLTRLP